MRYQERIYGQNQVSGIRNRTFNNFNMSSDICVFNTPLFNVSGATKINCTGSTTGSTYIISANTETIPLTFNFTGNTQTFIDTEANFRYQIYKYVNENDSFSAIPIYVSETLSYSAFSATNSTSQFVPSSGLTMDGDYLIKGFYQFSACTNYLKVLGKKLDTINYTYGTEYGIYNSDLDYYFVAISKAEVPTFVNNQTNNSPISRLFQSVLLPEPDINVIPMPTGILGNFILTLNGLVLAPDLDYTYNFSGSVVTLSGYTAKDDIITFIYTTAGGQELSSDNYHITSSIVSGATDGEGSNTVYFNTTTGKYEVYTSLQPLNGGTILVLLNGVALANNIDYFQSTTKPKRIILEGELYLDDIVTVVYFPQNGTANSLNTNNPIVSWNIEILPQKNNGFFSLEVSTGNTFNDFYYSGYTSYSTTSNYYSDTFVATGSVGTQLFYRVKNQKNYETICGDLVTTIAYSDVIPVVIQSNSINSY